MCEFIWYASSVLDLIAKHLLKGIHNSQSSNMDDMKQTRIPLENVMRLKMFILEIGANAIEVVEHKFINNKV